jgi:hypothetical protein
MFGMPISLRNSLFDKTRPEKPNLEEITESFDTLDGVHKETICYHSSEDQRKGAEYYRYEGRQVDVLEPLMITTSIPGISHHFIIYKYCIKTSKRIYR